MAKTKTSLYLFPAALAVVFISSVLIIVSPVGSKTIVPIPAPTAIPTPGPVIIASPDLSIPVSNVMTITGKIDRSWIFEGSFPVKLFDDQNKLLFQGNGSAPNWTTGTDKFTEFTVKIRFTTPALTGYLLISKDNPSGLPQNDQSVKFPIIFSNARH